MAKRSSIGLGRRERQIVDVVYELERATVADVRGQLPDPPSDSAVRAMLRLLEEKGHLKHKEDGPRYVYMPTVPRQQARRSALRHLLRTYFNGSTQGVMETLLDLQGADLSPKDLEQLTEMIESARKEGR